MKLDYETKEGHCEFQLTESDSFDFQTEVGSCFACLHFLSMGENTEGRAGVFDPLNFVGEAYSILKLYIFNYNGSL
jgi:hypothetical protein